MSIKGTDDYRRRLSELCSLPLGHTPDMLAFKDSYICSVLILKQHSTIEFDSAVHWACIFHDIIDGKMSLWNEICKGTRAEYVQLRAPSRDLYDHVLYKKLWHGLVKTYPFLVLDPRSRYLIAILDFLGWVNRLPVDLPDPQTELDDYRRRDEELRTFELREEVVEPLHAIAREWFADFSLDETFRPRLSTGSTADAGRSVSKKFSLFRDRSSYSSLLRCEDGYPLWYAASKGQIDDVAKVCVVPKQMAKNRIICMEPAALVAHQLGLSKSILRFIDATHHPIKKFLDINDQEVNRNLVRHGLRDQLATIDLSNASDSVSWNLIKRIFRGMPLLRYLMATRSRYYSIGREIYQTEKYAPMGSGLCFLIESIVFCLILEWVRRCSCCTRITQYHGWSVYGDDLIVPQAAYQMTVDYLGHHGRLRFERRGTLFLRL